MIDLTLDSILIPDIIGYTPPFGTKVARTAINKGGLSTQEVNNNIIASFVKMRGVVITTSDSTSDIEYDAKLLIEANAAITLTLGNATYRGCRVSIVNATSFTHTLNCTSVSTNSPIILPNTTFEIIWNGTKWQSLSAPAVGKRVTQFPQEEPPSTTYPCTKWELMTFDGAFFRAEGTNAAAFIEKTGVLKLQSDMVKSHTHGMKNHTHSGTTGSCRNLANGQERWTGWWNAGNPSNNIHMGGGGAVWLDENLKGRMEHEGSDTNYNYRYNINVDHRHDFSTGSPSDNTTDSNDSEAAENRPNNYTIRIWKRIA